MSGELVALIVRLGPENRRLGCARIQGGQGKLGMPVSASSVGRVLRRRDLGPAPAARTHLVGVPMFPGSRGAGHRVLHRGHRLAGAALRLFVINLWTREVQVFGVTDRPPVPSSPAGRNLSDDLLDRSRSAKSGMSTPTGPTVATRFGPNPRKPRSARHIWPHWTFQGLGARQFFGDREAQRSRGRLALAADGRRRSAGVDAAHRNSPESLTEIHQLSPRLRLSDGRRYVVAPPFGTGGVERPRRRSERARCARMR